MSCCGPNYNNYCGDTCSTSTYDCSNSCPPFYTMCPSGVAWAIDVAQFSTNTQCCDDYLGHVINIHNRAFLTLTQFQQMFYSDHKNLSTANPPQCDSSFSLIASPWVCPSGNTHIANTANGLVNQPNLYWSNGQPQTVFGPSSSSIIIPDDSGVQWCPNRTDLKHAHKPWVHVYQIPTAEADYIGWGGRYGWVPTNLLTLDPNRSYFNYNCLGGKDDPPYFFLGYEHDISNNGVYEPFQAQKTIMDNMVKDLDASLNCWDLCARASIYDQLFNLCFANEHSLNNCLELKCGRSWKEVIDAFPPTQTFNLQYGGGTLPLSSADGVENTIIFTHVPNNGRTATDIFASNGIVGTDAQGVLITRIRHATEDYPNATRTLGVGGWSSWVYEQDLITQNSIINAPWDIQPNTPYRITLVWPAANGGNVTWNYNVVNVGDFVSMQVNAKIHNDHCKVNTNTIKIKYICKVDQELYNYCGTPISSNRGFKQDEQGTFYSSADDESRTFNNVFLHSNAQSVTVGGGDDGALPAGAFDNCGTPPDTTAPSATMTFNVYSQSTTGTIVVTIVFSEAVIGFNSDNDVTVSNGTLATMTSSDGGITWTGNLTTSDTAGAATAVLGTFWTDIAGNSPISDVTVNYTVT